MISIAQIALTAALSVGSYELSIIEIDKWQESLSVESYVVLDIDNSHLLIVYGGNPGSVCRQLPPVVHETFEEIVVYPASLAFRVRC